MSTRTLTAQFHGLREEDKACLLQRAPVQESETSEWVFSRNESGHLQLQTTQLPNIKPIGIDFNSEAMKRKLISLKGKNQLLNKAVPLLNESSQLLDLSAGFGEDALCFANRGFHVTAVERNPFLFLLLQDALERLSMEAPGHPVVKRNRLQFLLSEAETFLEEVEEQQFDIVYFDPMFHKDGSALSSGRMQILQHLLQGESEPTEKLLALARAKARKRLVIKRGIQTPALISEVSHAFLGKAVRYDMYISQISS